MLPLSSSTTFFFFFFFAFIVCSFASDSHETSYYANADNPEDYFVRLGNDGVRELPEPREPAVYHNDDDGESKRNRTTTTRPDDGTTSRKQLADLENVTFAPDRINITRPSTTVLQINDFVRFKRGSATKNETNGSNRNGGGNERDGIFDGDRSGKMLLAPDDAVFISGNREPRRATKNQWFKRPQHAIDEEDDVVSSSATENLRAPRVHFVTQQRRSEPSSTRQFHYDRNPKELPLDPLAMSRDFYVRQSRHYHPYPSYSSSSSSSSSNYFNRDPYFGYDDYRRYEQKYEPPIDRDDGYKKPRRIIYYATLPEIVRDPAHVQDRFAYRDRYVTSRPLSVAPDAYRYRAGYAQSPKTRFEGGSSASSASSASSSSSSYPVKVSTDVHVGEVEKGPERRIYSRGDRTYAYKTPPSTYPENKYDRV